MSPPTIHDYLYSCNNRLVVDIQIDEVEEQFIFENDYYILAFIIESHSSLFNLSTNCCATSASITRAASIIAIDAFCILYFSKGAFLGRILATLIDAFALYISPKVLFWVEYLLPSDALLLLLQPKFLTSAIEKRSTSPLILIEQLSQHQLALVP